MKIAFIAPRYHTNQISFIKYFLKSKNQVSFYVTNISQIEDHSLLKPSKIDLNFFFKVIKFFFKSADLLFDYKYGVPSFTELLNFKSKKYNLVIIRDPIYLIGFSYFLMAKLAGIKVILYTQSEVYQNHYFTVKKIIKKFFFLLLNEKIISPCLGKKKFTKYLNKIYYLPFCLRIFEYKKKWFLDNKVNLVTIGKFIGRKKHLLLIRALNNIKVNNTFRLIIVGECSTQTHINYFNKIKREIKQSKLDVKILKNIKPSRIKNILKKSDVFILPSINESASVSNLEAMAFGLPVITTDSNSTSCYTKHRYNGYIVKSDDIDDLIKKLELLVNDKNKIKKFGQTSLNLVKNKHNPELVYKKFFKQIFKY